MNDAATARDLIAEAQRIVVLTGAGISTDSGIQDFRGPNGLGTKDPAAEKTATLSHYVGSADVRRRSWQQRLDAPFWQARPNAGHRAIVDLERRGTVTALVTQNVDGLHLAAGSDPSLVIEVHGTVHRYACLDCGAGGPMEDALERVRDGEDDPACRGCGGILKSATISFGQNLVADDLARAERAAMSCDLLLAVGSKLSVYPVAALVPIAKRAGARIVILNAEPTDFDHLADVVLRGSISELLPAIVA